MTAAVAVANLVVDFDGVRALDDVSFSVEEGDALALIGPNGAGKTTLLNCICGIYRITSGRVLLAGEDISRARPERVVRRGVARTFQNVEQFRTMTALDFVLVGRHQKFTASWAEAALRLPRSRREERENRAVVVDLLDRLQIGNALHEPLGTLPYGVRKRLDLARALASEPRVLVLDEPGAGMGDHGKRELVELLREMRGERYETMILVDHDVDLVRDLCRTAVVLDFGKKIVEGPIDDVLAHEEVTRAYLGTFVA